MIRSRAITKSSVSFQKDKRGRTTKMVIDLTKAHEPEVEDFADRMLLAKRREESTVPWDQVRAKLDKKHGIRDVIKKVQSRTK